jgi:hypothetical protein
MELHEALAQITAIRRQMAEGQVFRGYRALSTAFTGLVAFAAAAAQTLWVADPASTPNHYVLLWVAAAAASVVGVGTEMALRSLRSASPLQRQVTWLAVDQFIPSVVAGGLVTYVLTSFAPQSLWMLPGLWAVLFGLGVFASRRFMPASIFLPAAFYLLAGAVCLALPPRAALSPWTMGLTFGVGQLFTAAILYCTLERHHGRQ